MSKNSKVILITGCSSGFGFHTALHLISNGHNVVATMRNLAKKNSLLSEANKFDANLEVLQLDVTDQKSIDLAINEIVSKFGGIDVLINNAGCATIGFFEDLTDEEIRRQMETNLFGVINLVRKVIPIMSKGNNPKIINISSESGFVAFPCFSAYNCSKWALEAFSESLRYELMLSNIDVLLIEPGIYKTSFFSNKEIFSKNSKNPESKYFFITKKFEKTLFNYIEKCKRDPINIAKVVEKLINTQSPSFRNFPDFESRLLYYLKKIMPFCMFSWLLKMLIFRGSKSLK